MKYYIIAGERSGDLHASNLIKALKEQDPQAIIRGWGGDYFAEAGGEVVVHYKNLALMGFKEVIKGLRKIFKYLKLAKKDIVSFNPDVVILIDFAGFNLKIAQFSKQKGFKTFYYISPKVWAWNQSRANKIKNIVDRMFVILPFEKEFYKSFDYEVDYVGNPLVDSYYSFQASPDFISRNLIDPHKPIVAVLPGSRKQEVENMLSTMISIIPYFSNYYFVVAGVDNLPANLYAKIKKLPNVKVIFNETYDLLAHSEAAMVTSGTATLETALFEVPQVVCYKTSTFSFLVAKMLIKVKYISLVNLIAGEKVVQELIQENFNELLLKKELEKLLGNQSYREKIKNSYQRIKATLGNEKASPKLARLILKYLKEEN
jgi:lipid-A-disaccharide synthase